MNEFGTWDQRRLLARQAATLDTIVGYGAIAPARLAMEETRHTAAEAAQYCGVNSRERRPERTRTLGRNRGKWTVQVARHVLRSLATRAFGLHTREIDPGGSCASMPDDWRRRSLRPTANDAIVRPWSFK
jgi:hypothetical protein